MQSTKSPDVSPPKPSNITKTFGLVALLTVVSKIMGFARDVIVAEVFGTGAVADAYNYAYLYTGNVLVLFGGLGGPFHSATVSILSREKGKPESGLLMAQVFATTATILSVIAVLMFWLAPVLVENQCHDYQANFPKIHSDFIASTVLQLRWMSPLIVISGIIGVVYGILNVFDRIFWPSLSPLIASVAVIIGVKLFVDPSSPEALPLSLASMIGAFGQLIVQLPDLLKCKLPWRFSVKLNPLLKEYLIMLGPACFGTLVGQLTTYVDSMFTGKMPQAGDWTAIISANRLVQLPLGILATAMLVPMLPRFSALAQENDNDGIKLDYKKAFQFLIFLSMPLAVLLTALPEPIATVLYKRGNFTAESVSLVGEALWWLAPSIMFYLGRDLITRVFYAFKDSRTPFIVALIAIVVKYILDWFFIVKCKWSVGGISLATSFITVLNLSLLTFFLRKKIGRLGTTTMLKPVLIILLGGIACGALSIGTFLGWETFGAFEMQTDPKSDIRYLAHRTEPLFKWDTTRIVLIPTPEDLALQKRLREIATGTAAPVDRQERNPAPTKRKKFDIQEIVSSDPTKAVAWLSLAIGLALSCGIGVAAYLGICLGFKLDEMQMLKRRLLKKK